MIAILCLMRSDEAPQDVWKKYYSPNDIITLYHRGSKQFVISNSKNVLVYKGSFIDLTNRAIYINNSIKFLHSLCLFDSCSTNSDKYGGAIYFQGSSAVQDRFCSIKPMIPKGDCGHSYTLLTENNSNLNIVIESCITQCRSNHSTIALKFGHCEISSSNISRNNVHQNSGFKIMRASRCCIIKFSTFERNHAIEYICLEHYNSEIGKYHDYCCNIINNTQNLHQFGAIDVGAAELFIENCTVILYNSKGSCFSTSEKVSKLTIINCNVIGRLIHHLTGKYSTINVKFVDEMNVLPHISTHKCYAVLPIKSKEMEQITYKNYCRLKLSKTKTNFVPYFLLFRKNNRPLKIARIRQG